MFIRTTSISTTRYNKYLYNTTTMTTTMTTIATTITNIEAHNNKNNDKSLM